MYITIEVKEEEIKTKVTELVRDILQKEITMRWIKQVVEEEIRAESKKLIEQIRQTK